MNDHTEHNQRHIEIVETDPGPLGQPWHIRLRAGNGKLTVRSEQYVDEDTAREAVLLLGRTFSPIDLASLDVEPDDMYGYLVVWYDADEPDARFAIPVRYVNERTPLDTADE